MLFESILGNRRLKVLIVDDEPFMLHAWKRILRGQDCEVRTLVDSREAVPVAETWRPDVTVLDIRMPNLSGMEVLRELKARDVPTEVVMMTAFSTVDTVLESAKIGAFDCLNKPFSSIEEAALAVLKAARHRRLVQRNSELEDMLDFKSSFEGLTGSNPEMNQNIKKRTPAQPEDDKSLYELPYSKAKQTVLADFDRTYIIELLTRTNGNVSQASKLAGMDRSNFRRLIKKHNINPATFSSNAGPQ